MVLEFIVFFKCNFEKIEQRKADPPNNEQTHVPTSSKWNVECSLCATAVAIYQPIIIIYYLYALYFAEI